MLATLEGFGEFLRSEKRYPEAEKTLRETLDSRRRTFGDEHPDVAESAYNLATVQALEGKREDALSNLKFAFGHQLSPSLRSGMAKDPSFKSIEGDARFAQFVAASGQIAG
jgi:Tetratricopeptide repeat